jgi:UDP-glucuronate decarboxylase
MKTVLVSGGAGFVGSHLCDRLIADGAFVMCLDNLQTGSFENILHLIGHDRFHFVQQDIELPLSAITNVDQIYNLACPASPAHYQADPVRTMRTNVFGALNILELARRTKARVLQASTSEVYGDPEVHPQREDYRGCVSSFGPRACYDEGKRAAETLFHDYTRMYDVDIRIARIFNTYGPRMAEFDGRVVSNFILQALSGNSITIYGNGSQTRSFCYVTDLVNGLIKLMNSGEHMRCPCNLGNPEEFMIADLAQMVIEKTGSKSKLAYAPLPKDDPTRRCPDITMARLELGWNPVVPLRDGLDNTISYFKALRQQKVEVSTGSARVRQMSDVLFSRPPTSPRLAFVGRRS